MREFFSRWVFEQTLFREGLEDTRLIFERRRKDGEDCF